MKKHMIFYALILLLTSMAHAQTVRTEKAETPNAAEKTEVSKPAEKAKLPSPAEIFDRHVKAAGGRAALEKIKSRLTVGTVEMPSMGLKGTFQMLSKAPDKSMVVINLDGFGAITEAFDGREAWSQNPLQGLRVKAGEELEEVRQFSDFHHDLNLAKLYPKATVKGLEKADGKDAYVVKADDGTTFYFDAQSGLMTRVDRVVTSPQGKIGSVTKFEDFRETDGVRQAFRFRQNALGSEFVFNAAEVKQNAEITDERFSKPK